MMNKEYIIKLAQLITEYPILPIKAWVDIYLEVGKLE